MRIEQLPDIPASAGSAYIPGTFNGADYKIPFTVSGNAMYYQSGDTINEAVYCYGYVTSDSTQCTLICTMPKMFQSGASFTGTAQIHAAVRVVGGGYLDNEINADVTTNQSSITLNGSVMVIQLTKSAGWTYGTGATAAGTIPNNTPVAGYINFLATVR